VLASFVARSGVGVRAISGGRAFEGGAAAEFARVEIVLGVHGGAFAAATEAM
jgi:hypothetical protein